MASHATPNLVDVKRIRELNGLADGGRLTIGATVTHRSLERSPLVRARCPLVASVARHVANVRVRNVGTIGGNLALDRKSTRLNSSHGYISYAVFCLKKKK